MIDIVDYDPLYHDLGKTSLERQNSYREQLADGIKSINLNVRFLGSKEYITQMERKFKVNNLKGRKGRPKKLNK